MNRSVKSMWWQALAVALGVAIVPGAAQAMLMPYHGTGAGATETFTRILAQTGTDLSGWAPVGHDALRLVDQTDFIGSTLFHGVAGGFNLDEGSVTLDGPATVTPSRQRYATDSRQYSGDMGESVAPEAVPEPATLLLVGLGLVGIAGLARAQG